MGLVWISVCLLLGIIDAASTSKDVNLRHLGQSHEGVPRRLRSPPLDDDDNEDRMISPWKGKGVPSPNLSSTEGKNIHKLLEDLQLDKLSIVQADDIKKIDEDAVKSLFENSKFKQWTDESLAATAVQDQARLIYNGLLKIAKHQEEGDFSYDVMTKVAHMLDVAQRSRETKKLAEKLERFQFLKWRDNDYEKVLHLDNNKKGGAWNEAVYRRYKTFLKQNK